MRRFASIVLLSVALSACATAGSGKIDWNKARQVKVGMTQQEVKALLGDPYMVRTVGPGEVRYVWVHASAFGGAESVTLTFKDGKNLQALEIPDSFK